MKIHVLVLGVMAALSLLVPQPGFAQNSPFDRWDRNGDGKLTRDELPERIRGAFDRADANSDGFITRKEDAAFRARLRNAANRGGPRVKPTHADVAYGEHEQQKIDIYLAKS